MVGTAVKTKVGKVEEEIREGFSTRLRKEMTGVVQEVIGERSYFVRLQDCWRRRCRQTSSPLWSSGVK